MVRKGNGKAISQEEEMRMLFWYTAYDGNYSRVAVKITEEFGIERNRKVVRDLALRKNFATKAHLVRDQVNKHLYGNSDPSMNRLIKMGLDMLEINEQAVEHVKKFWSGRKTKIKDATEAMKIIHIVADDIKHLTGRDPKKNAQEYNHTTEISNIELSLKSIIESLPEDERDSVLEDIGKRERDKVLEYTSGSGN